MSAPHGSGGLDDLYEAAGKRSGEHRTLIVLGVVGLALTLILAAFVVGRGFAERAEQAAEPAPPQGSDADSLADAAVGGGLRPGEARSPRASASPSRAVARGSRASNGRLLGEPFEGPLRPVAPSGAAASCRARSSVDSGGNRVSYFFRHVLDDAASTAWRCAGNGRGVTLTLRLQRSRRIAEVGLVPGYAKTDPFNGVDRYAENRRIAKVRWSFDGVTWVEQKFDTQPGTRRLQTLRVPPVKARNVTVTIQRSVPAKRNTVAVSTVRLAGPRR